MYCQNLDTELIMEIIGLFALDLITMLAIYNGYVHHCNVFGDETFLCYDLGYNPLGLTMCTIMNI